MKSGIAVRYFLRPLIREIKHPGNWVLALLIGLAIHFVPGKGAVAWLGLVGLTFFILAITKAAAAFKNRRLRVLSELPAQRLDPAFVMDQKGSIVLSAGHTQHTFTQSGIHTLFDLFDKQDAKAIIGRGLETESDQPASYYSPSARKWYRVNTKVLPHEAHVLVWLTDITDQKMAALSLSVIRSFSNEIIGSINQLVKKNDSYDRLCRLIFKEGYEGVFITREDSEGDLSGHVCRVEGERLCMSDALKIDQTSTAPILRSKRSRRVVTATRDDAESQEAFEEAHPFDDRVKQFIGSPIINYVNYHEGDLSIIAFNKRDPISEYDMSVMETLGNTARSITRLIDFAVESDEKFLQIITGLCAAAEYSDELTGKHILRVNQYAKLMAQHLDQSPDFIDHISKVAALHDIGKVAIPEIIKLERALHPDELAEMRMHTIYGAQIIDKMLSLSGHLEPRLEMARAIALHHHQRWDGKGYPGLIDGNGRWTTTESKSFVDYARLRPLKGDEIPVAARIVSLADKYDALRSARSYKPPLSHATTCELLTTDDRHGSRGEDLFGTDLFGVFLDISDEFDMIYEEMRDHSGPPE